MKVAERVRQTTAPRFSIEILPPVRGSNQAAVMQQLDALAALNPAWVDVTSHATTAFYDELDGALSRKVYRARPGTVGVCGLIQNHYGWDAVPHLLCLGFSRQETEDVLLDLAYLGVHNILALRGDGPNFDKKSNSFHTHNLYASDLVEQIVALNNGGLLDGLPSKGFDFCVGVAGYPEKHFEAANLAQDLMNLKRKVDAGAEYVVTQMFFDNQRFFDFVKAARDIGIDVPIIPGIKMLKTPRQLTQLPKNFFLDLPEELVTAVMEQPDQVDIIGRAWFEQQIAGLFAGGVPIVHLYVMNDAKVMTDVAKQFIG